MFVYTSGKTVSLYSLKLVLIEIRLDMHTLSADWMDTLSLGFRLAD